MKFREKYGIKTEPFNETVSLISYTPLDRKKRDERISELRANGRQLTRDEHEELKFLCNDWRTEQGANAIAAIEDAKVFAIIDEMLRKEQGQKARVNHVMNRKKRHKTSPNLKHGGKP